MEPVSCVPKSSDGTGDLLERHFPSLPQASAFVSLEAACATGGPAKPNQPHQEISPLNRWLIPSGQPEPRASQAWTKPGSTRNRPGDLTNREHSPLSNFPTPFLRIPSPHSTGAFAGLIWRAQRITFPPRRTARRHISRDHGCPRRADDAVWHFQRAYEQAAEGASRHSARRLGGAQQAWLTWPAAIPSASRPVDALRPLPVAWHRLCALRLLPARLHGAGLVYRFVHPRAPPPPPRDTALRRTGRR